MYTTLPRKFLLHWMLLVTGIVTLTGSYTRAAAADAGRMLNLWYHHLGEIFGAC